MPTEVLPQGSRLRRLLLDGAMEVVIALPWLLFFYLSGVIACHRWAGWRLATSLALGTVAAIWGWHFVQRAAARYDDARLGDLLARVPDAPEWTLFPHPVQVLKRRHAARCRKLWGITPRTSGWERFRRSWRTDAAYALTCLVLTAHAVWSVW